MPKTKSRTFLESGRVLFVPVAGIRPNPSQPRRVFDPAGLQELAASIAQYGVLQPLTVRKSQGGLELVAGERRLRAARLAGLAEVPCIVVTADEEQSGMLALVENLQRRDLDFIEEAEGLARLMRLYGLTQQEAARRIGKSPSAVANKLRLLKLPAEVLETLREAGLTERHARALLPLADKAGQLRAAGLAAEGGWTVARLEQYIESQSRAAPAPRRGAAPFLLRDARVFLNSMRHSLELARAHGIDAACEQQETEQEIILTIRIPKQKMKKDGIPAEK